MHTPLRPPSQAPAIPPIDSGQSAAAKPDLRSTLAHLGMGKRHAVGPQPFSLELEVESYLTDPASIHEDLIKFWQVCSSVTCSGVLTIAHF